MAAKNKYTPLILAAIVAFIIIIFIIRRSLRRVQEAEESVSTPAPVQAEPTGSTSTPKDSIDGDTVFAAKTPYAKSKYIEWIQSTYNAYTKERKAAGKGDYPLITVDGVYGPQTANAVYRYMGQYHTSWNAFKTRIDYFRTKL